MVYRTVQSFVSAGACRRSITELVTQTMYQHLAECEHICKVVTARIMNITKDSIYMAAILEMREVAIVPP